MITKQDFPSINERPPEGIKDDGTKVRVLVVDDSMFVAKQIGQILTSEGYEVVATAVDGKDGVDKYKDLCKTAKLHPHILRAFFCSNALHNAGYSIDQVANQAGHSSLNTTKQYLISDRESIIDLANKL